MQSESSSAGSAKGYCARPVAEKIEWSWKSIVFFCIERLVLPLHSFKIHMPLTEIISCHINRPCV